MNLITFIRQNIFALTLAVRLSFSLIIRLIEDVFHGKVADQSVYTNRLISAYASADKNV